MLCSRSLETKATPKKESKEEPEQEIEEAGADIPFLCSPTEAHPPWFLLCRPFPGADAAVQVRREHPLQVCAGLCGPEFLAHSAPCFRSDVVFNVDGEKIPAHRTILGEENRTLVHHLFLFVS